MSTNVIPSPKKGAKLATKRRVLTIIILLLLSLSYVFWQETPKVILHNTSTEPLEYSLKLNNNLFSKGTMAANTQYTIDLPFLKGRNATIYLEAKTKQKIISSMTKTSYLGAVDFYIRPDLTISMESIPMGFFTEQSETDPIIVK